ncbi:MAG: hypothetical protein IPP36_10870 [Nitrosomonadales bacterium]|nr:hypothetical protein [Nitrosomonadales bacterium]
MTAAKRPVVTDGNVSFADGLEQQDSVNSKATPASPTMQQKAKGRRNTSPVLLPLTEGDGS